MKLHQLRYLAAVAQTGLNITAAADKLHTSQPGVSKQIKLLEDELGFQIFVRDGRKLTRVTPAGPAGHRPRDPHPARSAEHQAAVGRLQGRGTRRVVDRDDAHAGALRPAGGDQAVSRDSTRKCGCTCTRARPSRSPRWRRSTASTSRSPPGRRACSRATRCCRAIAGTATSSCRAIIRSRKVRKPTLRQLAAHPIVTYVFSFSGPSSLQQIFAKEGLTPNVVLTARDADVIKTYVRLGLGVGIVASMAIDPREDARSRADRHVGAVPGAHHVDRFPARRTVAQVPARLHPALRAAPDTAR